MAEIIYASNVRISFPHIVDPQRKINDKTGQEIITYSADFLFEQSDPAFAKFMQQYAELATEKVKQHAQQVMAMIQSDRKSRCYGQGSEKVNKKTFQVYDGYNDMLYITASRNTPPQMIQPDGKAVDANNTMAYQALARKIYGGCRVNVALMPWWQMANPEKQYGHGIRCELVAIQFAGDDKPFGEAVKDASGLFGAVAVPVAPVAAPAAPAMPAAPFAGLPPFLTGQ